MCKQTSIMVHRDWAQLHVHVYKQLLILEEFDRYIGQTELNLIMYSNQTTAIIETNLKILSL